MINECVRNWQMTLTISGLHGLTFAGLANALAASWFFDGKPAPGFFHIAWFSRDSLNYFFFGVFLQAGRIGSPIRAAGQLGWRRSFLRRP
jgi:hypothetical protein